MIPTASSIGDRVWSDANLDGIQNPGESGISGVTVHLLDQAGIALDSTTTDAGGYYLFPDLPPGTYLVEFDLPAGFLFTEPGIGSDREADSDADLSTGRTAPVVLPATYDDQSRDAGMVGTSLGDRVWSDANVNGLQDPGEPGISGALVTLNDGLGNSIDVALTDSNGLYRFQKLVPDDYSVQFALPAGYVFTASGEGTDPTMDSDANPQTGRSRVFMLTENEMDSSLDAGLAPDALVTVGVNRSLLGRGEKLNVSLLVNNQDPGPVADFYLGVLLPDGQTIYCFTDLAFNVAAGNIADLSTLTPIASGVSLSAPFVYRGPSLLTYTFSGQEPRGTYTMFLVAVTPGGLADGRADPSDILGSSLVWFMFTP